jgi:hypothetical protein
VYNCVVILVDHILFQSYLYRKRLAVLRRPLAYFNHYRMLDICTIAVAERREGVDKLN